MSESDARSTRSSQLRERVEAALREKSLRSHELKLLSPDATSNLLHELRVYQAELEMQNEELRRSQVELDASRASYFDLYDLAPVGYCTVSEPGLILRVNLKAASLLGVTGAKLVPQPFSRFIFRDEVDRYYLLRKRLLQTGMPQSQELQMVRGDGTPFWARLESTSARGGDGAQLLRVVLSDISDRKRSEAALQHSEACYRTLSEASTSGIWQCNLAGSATYVNRAMCQMLEVFSAEQLIGRSYESFFSQLSQQRIRSAHERHAEGKTSTYEVELVGARGTRRDVLVGTAPLFDDRGTLCEWVGTVTDITAQKQANAALASLEAQLHQSQKMEAIGTLAGGVAHDFNNMLAVILGNTELASMDLEANDLSANPGVAKSLDEIRNAGTRAHALVQQILSFSRRQPTERKAIQLAPVIDESVRLLRATLPARLMLEVELKGDLPAVLANATQLQQVVINLATNAMQAMSDVPGRIGICVDTVLLDAALASEHPALHAMHKKHPGRTVRLALRDTGSGMDAATLARAFEPFFTTKAVNEGSGLGLSIVHGVVQSHEGAIEVDSEPGVGTTFTLYLPAAEAPASEQTPDACGDAARVAETENVGGGLHVLYLDDDESVVSMVTRLLERRGYRVSGYRDQDHALAALRADPAQFDLVVTDYNMPLMSGLDVARAIRAIRPDLPVAVASGFVDAALAAQAEGAGVKALIFKGGDLEDLCTTLQRLAIAKTAKK